MLKYKKLKEYFPYYEGKNPNQKVWIIETLEIDYKTNQEFYDYHRYFLTKKEAEKEMKLI